MLTGESLPVEKTKGDHVTGGTINKNGSLVIEAAKVGADTVLSQIVEMVTNAKRSRAPIQGLADTVAAYFVPTVVAVAIIAFIAWMSFGPEPALAYAIAAAVSVLIIACPCALGLATPISITTAAGRGCPSGMSTIGHARWRRRSSRPPRSSITATQWAPLRRGARLHRPGRPTV
jgi:Cu+-exporting ATPase